MKEEQAQQIAHYIDEALRSREDDAALNRIKQAVHTLCTQFPIY
jgi:glycine/serine hydroxymethyltransferase